MRRFIFLVLVLPMISLSGCVGSRADARAHPGKATAVEMCSDGTGQKVYANVSEPYDQSCQSACAKVNPHLGFPTAGPDFKLGPDGYCCCYPK